VTTKKAAPARARTKQRAPDALTVVGAWRAAILEMLEAEHRIRFPSPRYRHDPVGFFRDILGVEPWSAPRKPKGQADQVDVLNAIRDADRVAWKSGRRVSKSHTAAGLALWFYCCWEYARVIMTSTTARQVDTILWRQLAMMRARAGRCVACVTLDPLMLKIPKPCPHSAIVDGDIGMLARTGLKSEDDLFREVWGFTAKEAEAVQGLAGPRMFFICDEASGIPDAIYQAIDGNRAGGAKVLLTGNPTKTTGEFFEAFTKKAYDPTRPETVDGYRCLTTSSELSPNITGGATIDGLATPGWIRERVHEWGIDSPLYRIHVLGEFATNEDGKIFSVDKIRAAEERHAEASDAGRLFLGVDPAGATGTGDESCFTARRGVKEIAASDDGTGKLAVRGLDTDGHLATILRILGRLATPREIPVVVIDRSGKIGAELYGVLAAHVHEIERADRRVPFELVGVRASDKAQRQPMTYDTVRDELAASLEQAFRDGAAIIEDPKLSAELHVLEWKQGANGRLKVTPKDEIKRKLGRSPDRYDSHALAFWDPMSLAYAPSTAVVDGQRRRDDEEDERDDYGQRAEDRINPYGGRR